MQQGLEIHSKMEYLVNKRKPILYLKCFEENLVWFYSIKIQMQMKYLRVLQPSFVFFFFFWFENEGKKIAKVNEWKHTFWRFAIIWDCVSIWLVSWRTSFVKLFKTFKMLLPFSKKNLFSEVQKFGLKDTKIPWTRNSPFGTWTVCEFASISR